MVDSLSSHHYPSTAFTQPSMSTGVSSFRAYYQPQNASSSGSQDSTISSASGRAATSVRSLMNNTSSDVSQANTATDHTSPISPRSAASITSMHADASQTKHPSHNQYKPQNNPGNTHRLRTPDGQTDASAPQDDVTSPMSISTPVNGVKRTANGVVKSGAGSLNNSPANATLSGRQRGESVSSSSSRAGEAAAQLKTRLAYAMAKVQHGWEHRSMAEVEQLAAASISPRAVLQSPRGGRSAIVSPRSAVHHNSPRDGHLPRSRVPIYPTAGHAAIPMSPPPKRRSVTHGFPAGPADHSSTVPSSHRARQPALGPPAEFGGQKHERRVSFGQYHSHYIPVASNNREPASPSSQPPSTPKGSRRPASIRTSTQTAQAEQDAMDALLLMGSPSNGGQFPRSSQQSSGQPSPRNARFAAVVGPRQALQYRSDSSESVSRSSEGALSSAGFGDQEQGRNQIEAGS